MSCCKLDLTFHLPVVSWTFKILSRPLKSCWPYLRICTVYIIDSWMGHWLGSVGMLSHGVTFNLVSAKLCSPTIFETYFSYNKDVRIAVTV